MTTSESPWWRRRRGRVLVGGAVVLVLAGALTLWLVARGGTDPVDAPVSSSTLEGYPTRGGLTEDGAPSEDLEAAADAWRREDVGGQEEPPAADEPLEVLWAGDVPAADLAFESRYEIRLGDAPTGRLVALRSGDHVASFLAPVDVEGDRTDAYRILADGDERRWPSRATVELDDGLLLLAESLARSAEPDGLEVVHPEGEDDDVPVVVTVPVDDGLLVGQRGGAIRAASVSAVPDGDGPGLLFTDGGVVTTADLDALWGRLLDPAAGAPTWSALLGAYHGTEERRRADPPVAALWDGSALSDGTPLAVVAVTTSAGDPRAWWEVYASRPAPEAVDGEEPGDPRTDRLGGGEVAPGWPLATRVPPLVAQWLDGGPGGDAERRPELVVAGGNEVVRVDVLASVDGTSVEGSTVTWPRPDPSTWARDAADVAQVGSTDLPPVVVVGRTADGTPVPVLAD
ncbi:hypothetical protein JOE63_001899 [Cellulosimicrobium cellulans]|uniref:hypothetical protein n=1 Tax=Cellulosimicrobium cellulans TaxID=1710 RepID=UPI001959FF28|nr:hypothetical protein [Cellulosimicrobium cellulans]MBM7819422.1 hypothetical protein [Cellulosimicrobium cellulans]